MGRLKSALEERVDGSSLALFRIGFGLLMAWEALRYLLYGWITPMFVAPAFHFPYRGFEWLPPLPAWWAHGHFALLLVLGLAISAGLFYRAATALFSICFLYLFLTDQAYYLNHFYLIWLLSVLMTFAPTHQRWSVDAWLWKRSAASEPGAVSAFWIWLLRFQVAVPYFFGGVAKLNVDWLRAQPILDWLGGPQPTPEQVHIAWALSYSGLLFDLLVVPFLLFRRTRPYAFVVAVGFHIMNKLMFGLGIFPPFMILATTIFFAPSWPRAIISRIRRRTREGQVPVSAQSPPRLSRRLGIGVVIWVAIQVLVPLRWLVYPGNPSWTEAGHRFAWHMKLRSKDADLRFRVVHTVTGESAIVDPIDYLDPLQERKLAGHPVMIVQFAHFLSEEAERKVGHPVQVFATNRVSMNGRKPQPMIDSTVDLTTVDAWDVEDTVVLPLSEPLPRWRW